MGYCRKVQWGIEVTGRQGRKRRKLLDDLKERRGYSHLKEEALDRTMWRARFGWFYLRIVVTVVLRSWSGRPRTQHDCHRFGPVVRQTTK
jgi:hypothetical protein